jgi:hypothetical protein
MGLLSVFCFACVQFIFEIDAHHLSVPQILSVACKATLLFFIFLDLYLFLLLLHEQAIQDAAVSSPFDHALTKGTAYNLQPQWIHLSLWLLLFLVAVCPFDFFHRSTRRYLFGTIWKVVTSPFSSVNFKDFFIADWLCSLVSVLGDVSYTFCFYGTGSFHDNENHRCAQVNSRYVLWVVSFLPYIWRLLQCLRRYRETGVRRQAWNAAKYSTSLLVTLTSLLDKTYGGTGTYWRALWIVVAIVGTAYSYCWDIVFDWSLWSGMLDRNSSDKWLRPKLSVQNRYVYHGAIGLNLLLRGFWVLTISPAYTEVGIPNDIKLFLVYSLEVFRRAMWSFFRLENEVRWEYLRGCPAACKRILTPVQFCAPMGSPSVPLLCCAPPSCFSLFVSAPKQRRTVPRRQHRTDSSTGRDGRRGGDRQANAEPRAGHSGRAARDAASAEATGQHPTNGRVGRGHQHRQSPPDRAQRQAPVDVRAQPDHAHRRVRARVGRSRGRLHSRHAQRRR